MPIFWPPMRTWLIFSDSTTYQVSNKINRKSNHFDFSMKKLKVLSYLLVGILSQSTYENIERPEDLKADDLMYIECELDRMCAFFSESWLGLQGITEDDTVGFWCFSTDSSFQIEKPNQRVFDFGWYRLCCSRLWVVWRSWRWALLGLVFSWRNRGDRLEVFEYSFRTYTETQI